MAEILQRLGGTTYALTLDAAAESELPFIGRTHLLEDLDTRYAGPAPGHGDRRGRERPVRTGKTRLVSRFLDRVAVEDGMSS